MNAKIIGTNELAKRSKELRKSGKKLVVTNGCFDLLHVGHVRYLQAARQLGDALAVAVNGDRSVTELKGAGRPLNNEHDRAEVIAAMACVDFVAIFQEKRASSFLKEVAPAIYAKGGDYKPETLDAEEKAVLQCIGAEIRIIPFEAGYSTTKLIERLAGERA
ncbi:MAG: adenylyltransferase/cytidyltransferase family protein [Spartobacteria bacterium]